MEITVPLEKFNIGVQVDPRGHRSGGFVLAAGRTYVSVSFEGARRFL
jgi:hypothetical protein